MILSIFRFTGSKSLVIHMQLALHSIVLGYLPAVLETQDLLQAQCWVQRSEGRFRTLRRDPKPPVVPGQEFGDQPVLEGGCYAFNLALGACLISQTICVEHTWNGLCDRENRMPLREMNREQMWLLPPTLDDLLPLDHPARFVAEFVDALGREDWKELGVEIEGDPLGAAAYHPRALLSVWLYGFMTSIRSSRKLVSITG